MSGRKATPAEADTASSTEGVLRLVIADLGDVLTSNERLILGMAARTLERVASRVETPPIMVDGQEFHISGTNTKETVE